VLFNHRGLTIHAIEPKPSPKPQPFGNEPLLVVFTICVFCALFLLYRRASSLKTIVTNFQYARIRSPPI
jgi:hypothetical protein